MRKLVKLVNGKSIVHEGLYVAPNSDDPIVEFNLDKLEEKEYQDLKKNPNDKVLLKRIEKKFRI